MNLMAASKRWRNRFIRIGAIKNGSGISTVISTVIVSSALLTILVISSFFSGNILELQMASTEFEQAKANMMLLDEVIQDVALRRGSGGYVQFNQRSGGINVIEHADRISIYAETNATYREMIYNSTPLISLDYRGGTHASSADTVMRGTNFVMVQGLNASLSHLRVEAGQGVWIRLDYYRVRIVEMGTLPLNPLNGTIQFIGITFLRLERGKIGGLDLLNVKVQNIGINTTSYTYNGGSISIETVLGSKTESYSFSSDAQKVVVMLTEVWIRISTA